MTRSRPMDKQIDVPIDRPMSKSMGGLHAALERLLIWLGWHNHDDLTLDLTGFLTCPVSGCAWKLMPGSPCPEHPKEPTDDF